LGPGVLARLLASAKALANKPRCEVLEEVLIHPVYLNLIKYNGEEEEGSAAD
jgi:hypothetical protein